jgi:hypothetical protein
MAIRAETTVDKPKHTSDDESGCNQFDSVQGVALDT